VAVWAHPFWDIENSHEVVAALEEFVLHGLDGVETLYVTHDPLQAEVLDEACRSLDLLSTGSSDFHGPDHAIFSRFRAHPLHGLEPHLGPIASAAAARSSGSQLREKGRHENLHQGRLRRAHRNRTGRSR
jgi:3',5'-nucleoside bisphosphate phosphatase